MQPKIITLNFPAEIGGRIIDKVTISRFPTARDLHIAGGDLDDDEIHFRVAANLVELAPAEFGELDFEDIERIQDAARELAEQHPTDISGIELRRLKGKDVLALKKDYKVAGLVKSLVVLTGLTESALMDMNSTQFLDLVGRLMDFIGRRRTT